MKVTMNRFFTSSMLAFALAACASPAVEAASLSTTVTWIPSSSFWFEAAGMEYVSGGSGPAFGGEGKMFCFAAFMDAPNDGEVHVYELMSEVDAFAHPTGAARGMDLIHWLMDSYYDAWFISGDPTGADYSNTALFQNTIWEIAEDYDGSLSSLDSAAGNIKLVFATDLVTAEPSIPVGYRSSVYHLQFLSDTPPYDGDQRMLLITAAIPEPGSLALLGFAAVLVAQAPRRRRSCY